MERPRHEAADRLLFLYRPHQGGGPAPPEPDRRGSVPDLPQAALSCVLPTAAGAGPPGDRSRCPAPAAGDGAGAPALPDDLRGVSQLVRDHRPAPGLLAFPLRLFRQDSFSLLLPLRRGAGRPAGGRPASLPQSGGERGPGAPGDRDGPGGRAGAMACPQRCAAERYPWKEGKSWGTVRGFDTESLFRLGVPSDAYPRIAWTIPIGTR